MPESSLHYPGFYVIGRALREHRSARKMSLRQLARLLDISPSHLSGWENGDRRIPAIPLGWMLGLLKVPPTESHLLIRLHAMAERASYVERIDSDVLTIQRAYDRFTLHTYEWAPRIVPDLLQTFDYAHALPGAPTPQPDKVDQEIFARRVRQVDRDPRHRHTLLLGSAALTLECVPPEVLQTQLQAITNPGSERRVDTRIVTAETSIAATIEPFIIYETTEKASTVVLKHAHSTVYLSDPTTVQQYKATFDAIQRKAVSYEPTSSC
ncbi:Scr1 family TA system antitoxin-like transcriptional regulator [Amycolatopsis sp. NPDC004625]|uniref:Scr1 family TA system antitoxin-like transcriptional regulator n=1 Tax=Amycolatopsis sp. NPDC004625 TaxID=3154670 RepID=UPI0033A6E93C